jgi:hypothetical protein
MKSLNKLIRAVDENKPLALFLCSVFVAGWQASAMYSKYAPKVLSNYEDVKKIKSDLSRLKTEIEVLKVREQGKYSKNISMIIADREDRLKRCNRKLSDTGEAFNNVYAHHQRCLEREKSIRYAKTEAF